MSSAWSHWLCRWKSALGANRRPARRRPAATILRAESLETRVTPAVIYGKLTAPRPAPDHTPPAVAITSQVPNVTSASPVIAGSVTDNVPNGLTLTAKVDGGTAQSVPLTSTRTFSFNPNVTTNASHTVTFQAKDAAGNLSAVKTVTFTVDSTETQVTAALDAASDTGVAGNNTTELQTVTIKGTAPASTSVTLLKAGAATGTTVTADANGAFSVPNVSLASGANFFSVASTNSSGQKVQFQLKVVRNTAPQVASPVTNFSVAQSTTASPTPDSVFNLPTIFDDTDVNSLVQFVTARGSTVVGTFQVELFDQQVGATVANFLKYVTGTTTSGASYANTIFHRKTTLATDGIAVLQGGGYKPTGSPITLPHIATDAAIALQSGLTNSLGTIAMARSDVANTATSEFFFNTADNRVLDADGQPDSSAPGSGDGYAVFGVVRGNGMSVVNASYAVPAKNEGGAFASIPLNNYNGTHFPSDTTLANYERVASASVLRTADPNDPDALTFAVSGNSNPNLVSTSITNGKLTLHYATGVSGVATITLKATDANGASAQTQFTVTVGNPETTPPTVAVTSPADGQTFATAPTITGTATDNVGVTQLQASVDGAAPVNVPVGAQGSFSFTPTLPSGTAANGRHTVTFTALDAAGNQSAPANLSFTIQTSGPAVTIASPQDGQTFKADPTVTGQVASGVTHLQAAVDSGTAGDVAIDGQGHFAFTPTLPTDGSADGAHTVTFTGGGTTTPVTFHFSLDTVAPTVSVTSPANNQTVNANPTISGHVADTGGGGSLTAVVDTGAAQTVTVDAQGNFTFTPALATDGSADGPHTVTFTDTDAAGNQSTPAAFTYTLDTTAPALAVTSPPFGWSFQTSPTVHGTATDATGVQHLTVSVDGGPTQDVPVDANGNFSYNANLTADGYYVYEFVATDAAGNVSKVTYTHHLDTTPPTVTITGPADGQTFSSNPTIQATAADNIDVGTAAVYVDGAYTGNVYFSQSHDFSYTTAFPTDGSADGPHTITFIAQDPAGNNSAPADFHFTLQTT